MDDELSLSVASPGIRQNNTISNKINQLSLQKEY
jgi:hypothetical protein